MRGLYIHVYVSVKFRKIYGMFGDSSTCVDKGESMYVCVFKNI